jgi:hypothetical protein
MHRSPTTQSTISLPSRKGERLKADSSVRIAVDPLTIAVALGLLPSRILELDTHCVSG